MLKFLFIVCIGLLSVVGVKALKDSLFNICMSVYYSKNIDKLKEEISKYDDLEHKHEYDESMVALSLKTILTESILNFVLGIICVVTVVGMLNFMM